MADIYTSAHKILINKSKLRNCSKKPGEKCLAALQDVRLIIGSDEDKTRIWAIGVCPVCMHNLEEYQEIM